MKTAQIKIGGEERTLDFSRAGLYDHIEEASNMPAFDFLKSISPDVDGEVVKEKNVGTKEMAVLIYAGLNSALDVAGKDNIKFDVVLKWLRSVETERLSEVYNAVFTAMSTEGEAPSQPAGSN